MPKDFQMADPLDFFPPFSQGLVSINNNKLLIRILLSKVSVDFSFLFDNFSHLSDLT